MRQELYNLVVAAVIHGSTVDLLILLRACEHRSHAAKQRAMSRLAVELGLDDSVCWMEKSK